MSAQVDEVFTNFLLTASAEEQAKVKAFARVVRDAVLAIEKLAPETIGPHIEMVRRALADRGLGPNCLVRTERAKSTAAGILEWYAGQLLAINDNKSWFAMNSFINLLDSFCPACMCEGSDAS